MEFFKKHKNLLISIIIFILVLLLALVSRKLLTNTENKAIYGDRLKEVNVKVNEKDIESKLSDLKDGVEESYTVKKKIMEYAEKNLAHYMLPREYIYLKEFPRTKYFKVDYNKLKESIMK